MERGQITQGGRQAHLLVQEETVRGVDDAQGTYGSEKRHGHRERDRERDRDRDGDREDRFRRPRFVILIKYCPRH